MPITWKSKPAGLSGADLDRWGLLVVLHQTACLDQHTTIEDLGTDRYRLHLGNGHDLAQPCRDHYCDPKGCPGLNKCGHAIWRRRRVQKD